MAKVIARECLIIFTRYPEPGKTKTRLIPLLGVEGAANLQRQMTENTLMQVGKLQSYRPIDLEVYFTGSTPEQIQAWLGANISYRQQCGDDLGMRMMSAFEVSFAAGMSGVIIIGTDCLDLDDQIMARGFELLERHDLVLGPAQDGGYYLIGLRRLFPQLFVGIDWGTSQVRQQTVDIAQKLNLAIAYLPILYDIDRPEDWSLVIGH